MKFGGTSVEGATAFQNAARIVADRVARRPVVVVSAMAGFTDALLGSVKEALGARPAQGLAKLDRHFERHRRVIDALLSKQAPRLRELVDERRNEIKELLNAVTAEETQNRTRRKALEDAVASNGERLSAALLAAVLLENNYAAMDVDSRRCIITDDDHGCATRHGSNFSLRKNNCNHWSTRRAFPCGRFYWVDCHGQTTTLGRGGFGLHSRVNCAALGTDEIQI